LNTHSSGEVVFHTFEVLARVPGLSHAVSTRRGGVSRAPYDSLNLGLHVGDEPAAVRENRRRFASAVGFATAQVATTRQVHGVEVRTVGRAGALAGSAAPDPAGCDGLVTHERGVFLMGFSADCPLVMCADAGAGVLGLAHTGWRGAFAGIIGKTLAAMAQLGASPESMVAAISPAIGPCCYEVGGELKDALPEQFKTCERFFLPHGGKFLLDLPGVCRERLAAGGVREENIESANTCSRCHEDAFFSYRSSGGRTGRYAAVIGWTD